MKTRPQLPIPWSDLELDKTGGGWVLTAWPADVTPTVLRVRIPLYTNVDDPFRLILEVRDQNCREFTQIGTVYTSAHALVTGEADEEWSDIPPQFRSAFLAMAHTVGAVMDLTELGGTIRQRYAGEPHTSRDYFYFGATDDRPQPSSVEPSSSA